MEKTIKSYVENFEHGWEPETLINSVAECLWRNHMVRTAERLTKMGEIPALKKIYGMIGETFTPAYAS